MREQKSVVGYRVCRVQRSTHGEVFTLPMDSFRFDTAKQAFDHASKHHAIRSRDTSCWVQEIFSDGTFSEAPKPIEELEQSQAEVPGSGSTPNAERKLSDWEQAWGYKKPVVRGVDERGPVKAQAPWANKRMEVTNEGKITATDETTVVREN